MSVAELHRCIADEALPLWGSIGFDKQSDQFVEQITLDGVPMLEIPRRVMVQARQIYVFGLAHQRGWFSNGDQLAFAAYQQLVKRYSVAGNGSSGWAFSINSAGEVINDARDLYAQAFVLLALATIRRLGGGNAPLRLAHETLSFLDAKMAAPAGGYYETYPRALGSRRQNPHMHLLEALLAWHELVPEDGFDKRALAIMELLQQRFIVQQNGVAGLVEYFDDALTPLGGPDYSCEPGHHFEWVWLLTTYATLTGCDCTEMAKTLWEHALRFGFRADDAIFDEISISGRPIQEGTRLWPLTEALKAINCGYPIPLGVRARAADDVATTLLNKFLRPAPAGLWFDHFDSLGRLKRNNVPASSLYHLCCALSQYPSFAENRSSVS